MNTALRKQIIEKRKDIYTDEFKMSIGELINLYKEGEIILDPAFQRLFRWSEQQETNFIESLLLGYPIPPIFVLQREDGKWDVIDGVQRLSTIYHFAGILKHTENKDEPLKLKKPTILTELENAFFSENFGEKYLDRATSIDFRRASLSILILQDGSDPNSKFELFKRLNTGGTHLSAQEMRNSIILMLDSDVHSQMKSFCNNDTFQKLINIPENSLYERTDMEILTRYIIMQNITDTKLSSYNNSFDINDFLDEIIEDVIKDENFNINKDLEKLDKLVTFLSNEVEPDYGFRIFNHESDKFMYAFNWFVFEVLIWGSVIVDNFEEKIYQKKKEFINIIKSLGSITDYEKRENISKTRVIQRLKLAKKEAELIFNEF